MRIFGWSMLGALAIALQAAAQPPVQENLDTVLRGWEKGMTDLKSFAVVIDRTALDKSLKTEDKYKGHALFVKGNVNDGNRAVLELYKTTNQQVYEKYICTGKLLYEYAADAKEVRIHEMPQNKQGQQQESFLSFLFGMGAEDAKKRYFMEHIPSNPPDKYYHYLRVRPKMELDKGDFAEARLSLFRANNLPAQIWYLQPNKNEITWNFTKLQLDVQIPPDYFQPKIPQGWTAKRIPPRGPLNAAPAGGRPKP